MKSLAQKIILVTTLLVTFTTTAISLVFYNSGKELLINHAMEDLGSTARQEGSRIQAIIGELKNDTLFLAGTPPVQGIIRAKANNNYDNIGNSSSQQWHQRLENIFTTLLHAKPHYLQVRLIDAQGQEKLRVEKDANQIFATPKERLQNKYQTVYTRQTLKLPSGQVYLSDISLNREHGEIVTPHTPVIRSATPVYDDNGIVMGFIIINLNFGDELSYIEELYRQGNNDLIISDHHGHYLVHPDTKKRFGFELGHRYRVQEDHPRLAKYFIPSNKEKSITLLPKETHQNAMVMVKLYFDQKRSDRYLALVLARPYQSIIEEETAIIQDNLWIGLIIILISTLLAYAFSRQIIDPLKQITAGIKSFQQNEIDIKLPDNTHDEIGVLTTAFSDMMQQVKSSETSLKELNSHLEQEIENRTAELHKSEQRWQFALDGAQQGVWDWDIKTNEVYFSKQWKAMLGFAEHELENNLDEWSKRVHPDDMPNVMEDVKNHFSGVTALYKNEHRVLCKDGSYIWILDQGMVVERDAENNPVRMIGTHTDISERHRIDKMKNEFISTVSHELRTPLTSIRGSLGLITGGAVGEMSEQAESLLSIAHKNTERLLLLINDILDLQKIEAGNMPFDFKDTQLDVFMADAINSNQPFAEAHEVSIELNNHTDTDTQLIADSDRLLQVMNNLLSNAAKFSPSTSKIIVDVSSNDSEIVIAISDQGPGIPEKFRDKLFEKFTQSDSSDTRNIGGTGLGLSIAKLIIEKHNGSINYETTMGQGTTFYIHLPYLSSTTTKNTPLNQIAISGRDILIIEDDADIATLLSLQLKNANYQPQIANSAEQAWELLHTQKFDAITLDIVLPGQDGVSFIKQLRQSDDFCDLPIIVISVRADAAKKELNGGAVGLIDWLNKPFNHVDLKRILNQAIKFNSRPHILYVEDDPDIQHVVTQVLNGQAKLTLASTYKEAKQQLTDYTFDLVLLDVSLPDGNGLDLLVDIDTCLTKPQVVIFSANPVSTEDAERVSAVLIKSQTTNDELMNILIKLTTA